jgi:hypothetical protein
MIPHIVVLDKPVDSQEEVINIDLQEGAVLLTALVDVTIAIIGEEYPCGTLKFKKDQSIILPSFDALFSEEL